MNRFTMFKVNDLGLAIVTVTNTNDIHLMKKIIPYCWYVWMKKIYPKTGRRLRLQRRQVSWNTHSAPFGREYSNMKSSSLFSRLFLSQYST